ncbi:hypothetical protein, partial [Alicyclobacillus herbarius]|uniref:hypothetical protein n=1 Tax=Alicyclobacillus herbarius TaxID=122960 RepID=UPI002355984F
MAELPRIRWLRTCKLAIHGETVAAGDDQGIPGNHYIAAGARPVRQRQGMFAEDVSRLLSNHEQRAAGRPV